MGVVIIRHFFEAQPVSATWGRLKQVLSTTLTYNPSLIGELGYKQLNISISCSVSPTLPFILEFCDHPNLTLTLFFGLILYKYSALQLLNVPG